MRRIEASGTRSEAASVAGGIEGGDSGGFPRLARHGEAIVFAWSESAVKGDGSEAVLVSRSSLGKMMRRIVAY